MLATMNISAVEVKVALVVGVMYHRRMRDY
jgi:hypothetical protein